MPGSINALLGLWKHAWHHKSPDKVGGHKVLRALQTVPVLLNVSLVLHVINERQVRMSTDLLMRKGKKGGKLHFQFYSDDNSEHDDVDVNL